MRGKGNAWDWFFTGTRITPAYAGKSSGASRRQSSQQDHPRLCGEKSFILTPSFAFLGSPPPMRGKVSQADQDERGHGITPAYAGKRASQSRLTSRG